MLRQLSASIANISSYLWTGNQANGFTLSLKVNTHVNGQRWWTNREAHDRGWFQVFLLCCVLRTMIFVWFAYLGFMYYRKFCDYVIIWLGWCPKLGYDACGCVKGDCVCLNIILSLLLSLCLVLSLGHSIITICMVCKPHIPWYGGEHIGYTKLI